MLKTINKLKVIKFKHKIQHFPLVTLNNAKTKIC